MNLTANPRRLWTLITLVGVVVIVAAGWFLFISGQKSEATDLGSQADSARQQAAVARSKITALTADNAKLPAFKAQLAELQKALPASPSSAQFVADMQRLGTESHVTIMSINVTPPSADQAVTPASGSTGSSGSGASTSPSATPTSAAPSGGATSAVASGATKLPITVSAQGAPADLERFLKLLQTSEPRALLVGQVAETVPGPGAAAADVSPSITISMNAFFQPTQ